MVWNGGGGDVDDCGQLGLSARAFDRLLRIWQLELHHGDDLEYGGGRQFHRQFGSEYPNFHSANPRVIVARAGVFFCVAA